MNKTDLYLTKHEWREKPFIDWMVDTLNAPVRWAYGCPWDSDTCRKAAEGGHLALITYSPNIRQWLRENGCPGSNK